MGSVCIGGVSGVSLAEANHDSGKVFAKGRLNALAAVVSTPPAAPVIATMCVLTWRVESCPHDNADR